MSLRASGEAVLLSTMRHLHLAHTCPGCTPALAGGARECRGVQVLLPEGSQRHENNIGEKRL